MASEFLSIAGLCASGELEPAKQDYHDTWVI